MTGVRINGTFTAKVIIRPVQELSHWNGYDASSDSRWYRCDWQGFRGGNPASILSQALCEDHGQDTQVEIGFGSEYQQPSSEYDAATRLFQGLVSMCMMEMRRIDGKATDLLLGCG